MEDSVGLNLGTSLDLGYTFDYFILTLAPGYQYKSQETNDHLGLNSHYFTISLNAGVEGVKDGGGVGTGISLMGYINTETGTFSPGVGINLLTLIGRL